MHTTLRRRLLLVVTPVLLLLLLTGSIGAWLLVILGQHSSAILRENYDSVRAMNRLQVALQQIELARQMRLSDNSIPAQDLHNQAWEAFSRQFHIEENNITILPDEPRLVVALRESADRYRRGSDAFMIEPHREELAKLATLHREIATLAQQIHDLNETHMQQASQQAQETAQRAIVGFSIGMLVALASVLLALWWMDRTLVVPLQAMRDAAIAIGQGDLQLLVPVASKDEMGELADEFNAMTRKLRAYKQSDLELLRRAQQTRQATIDSFPDPIIVLNPAGQLESANPAALQLFGLATPGVNTRAPRWQPPESLQTMVENVLAQRLNVESSQFSEAVSFRFQNAERFYLPQARRIESPEGEYLGTAVVLTDVTRFRLLDKFKTDWVATVSHELKTPLTSVRLAVHVLLAETVGPLEPKQLELLLEARDSTERLFQLIEQLLALARLEDASSLMHSEPTDVRQLLQSCIQDIAPRLRDKQLTLQLKSDTALPNVLLDAVRMKRALANLLDNAVQYTPAGGTITLLVSRTAGSLTITIRDTGVGIPAEYLPHVFERFFRVPGQNQPAGTGLGLAIVKEIVEAHSGTITCESQPSSGTVFTIHLPFAEGTP